MRNLLVLSSIMVLGNLKPNIITVDIVVSGYVPLSVLASYAGPYTCNLLPKKVQKSTSRAIFKHSPFFKV